MTPKSVKKSKKAERRDRRALAEQMRQEQKQRERRRTLTYVGGSTLLGLAILAAAILPAVLGSDDEGSDISSFGVAATAASCDATRESSKEAKSGGQHVEGKVTDYESVPPAAGKHNPNWVRSPKSFYDKDEPQPVEMLVHNLEHGFMVVWYLPTIADDQRKELEELAEAMAEDRPRTVVAPWDPSYGEFPEGKTVAMTTWGFRQLCGAVSGEAVKSFSDQHPSSEAPEPNAAI